MQLILVGLDFKTATVELRERLAFQPDRIREALRELYRTRTSNGCSEVTILSTCNRVEVYAVAPDDSGVDTVIDFMAGFHDLPRSEFEGHLYALTGDDVTDHLFAVASSTQSMVLGETQIQAQIKQAFEAAQSHGTVGIQLSALFRHALRVGKRVRNETSIGEHSLSISHAAVSHIHSALGDLAGKHIVIVGIGKMSQLTIKALKKYGAEHITVVNRTKERIAELTQDDSIAACDFGQLESCLASADVVISSTAAPHVIISHKTMASVANARQGRPMMIFDIAVPRDVEPNVGEIDGITLLNIDELQARIDSNRELRCAELAKVRRIVEEEVHEFDAWRQSLEVKPLIVDLRKRADQIREQELERAMRRLEIDLSSSDSEIVQDLTRRIVNKMLHQPIVNLRTEAEKGNAIECAGHVRRLFGLEAA